MKSEPETESVTTIPVFIRLGPSPEMLRALILAAFVLGMLFANLLLLSGE